MTDIKNFSARTFYDKSPTLRRQLIKEQHQLFFKHLVISDFTHLVVIWNMPSKQAHQLVFNCTWEDRWKTLQGKLSPFFLMLIFNDCCSWYMCRGGLPASCKVTPMILLLLVAPAAENQTTAKSVYTYKVTLLTVLYWWILPSFLGSCFLSHFSFHSLLPWPIFFPFLSEGVKGLALEMRGGSRCLTKGGFSCAEGDKDASPRSCIVKQGTV